MKTLAKWKPCPFCGNTKSLRCSYYGDESVSTDCGKCGARGPHTMSEITAIKKWNKRSSAK